MRGTTFPPQEEPPESPIPSRRLIEYVFDRKERTTVPLRARYPARPVSPLSCD